MHHAFTTQVITTMYEKLSYFIKELTYIWELVNTDSPVPGIKFVQNCIRISSKTYLGASPQTRKQNLEPGNQPDKLIKMRHDKHK